MQSLIQDLLITVIAVGVIFLTYKRLVTFTIESKKHISNCRTKCTCLSSNNGN